MPQFWDSYLNLLECKQWKGTHDQLWKIRDRDKNKWGREGAVTTIKSPKVPIQVLGTQSMLFFVCAVSEASSLCPIHQLTPLPWLMLPI
jgi:hypothetical protein